MRLALPERPIRRADVLIASSVVVWLVGWTAVWVVGRQAGSASPASPLAAILLVGAISLGIEAPFLYGLARGRRWGFVGMVVLSAMGSVGTFVNPLIRNTPITPQILATALFDDALLAYCGARLWQTRVERPEAPRSTALRLSDALLGALGAAWPLGFAATIVRNAAGHPTRPSDIGFFGWFGLWGLLYEIAAMGVVLGRRWGFVSMIVMSAFILMGLVPGLLTRRYGGLPETIIAAFSAVALVYCAFRLVDIAKGQRKDALSIAP